jgi:predicted  nucleic acid-binding Zn-ribbon protein
MAIPVELLNNLLSHTEKPVLCPSCGRILYLADALRESYADKSAAASR